MSQDIHYQEDALLSFANILRVIISRFLESDVPENNILLLQRDCV